MPIIVQDNFDESPAGVVLRPQWVTHVASGGTVGTLADPTPSPTRINVLKIAEAAGSTSDYCEAKLVFPHPYDQICWVFESWPLQGSKTLYFGVYVGATRYDIVRLSASGQVQYRASSGTWTNLGITYTSNTSWVRYRIVVDRTAASGELAKFTRNDIDIVGTTPLDLPSIPGPIEAVAFATESTEDSATFYIDNVQVLERMAVLSDVVRDQNTAPIAGARVVAVRQIAGIAGGVSAQPPAGFSALTNAYGVYSVTVESGLYYVISAYHASLNTYGGAGVAWAWGGGN